MESTGDRSRRRYIRHCSFGMLQKEALVVGRVVAADLLCGVAAVPLLRADCLFCLMLQSFSHYRLVSTNTRGLQVDGPVTVGIVITVSLHEVCAGARH